MISTIDKINIMINVNEHGLSFSDINTDLEEANVINLLNLKDIKPKFTSEDYKKFSYYKKELIKDDLFLWQEDLSEEVIVFIDIMLMRYYSYDNYGYEKRTIYEEKINLRLLNKENLKFLVKYLNDHNFIMTFKNINYSAIYNLLKMDISKSDLISKVRKFMYYTGDFDFLMNLEPDIFASIDKLNIFQIDSVSKLKNAMSCYNNPEHKGIIEFIDYVTYKKFINNSVIDNISCIEFSNLEKKLEIIKELESYIHHDKLSMILVYFIECYNLKLSLLNKLLYNIKKLSKKELTEFNEADTQISLINILLDYKHSNLLGKINNERWTTCDNLISLLNYCINNKKYAFLKLIDNEEVYNDIREINNLLFDNTFQSIINLNTLNAGNIKDIKSIEETNGYKKYWTLSERLNQMKVKFGTLTFNEFKELIEISDSEHLMNLYNCLTLKVDVKIKTTKEIVNIPNVKTIVKEYENYKELAQMLNEKNFSKRVIDYSYIENLSKEDVLNIMLNNEVLSKYLGDIKYDYEINFVLNNYNENTKDLTLDELKDNALKLDSNIQELITLLNLSEEFKEENLSNIKEFCTKGLSEIAMTYYRNNRVTELQKKNLLLIVKAVFAGKLKELKYGKYELEKELSLNSINESVKAKWSNNTSLHYKGVTAKEFDDFESTMKIGEVPTHTCMSWIDGSYSECLLSNFDSNKKIINTINGKTVSTRAILRLTKIRSNLSEKVLEFKDITDTEREENDFTNDEELGFFLEKPYEKGLKPEMVRTHLAAIVELAKQKAKDMGVTLIVSSYYKQVMKGQEESEKYIYISRSKNGKQYLDSLSGEVTVSDEGKYRRASNVFEIKN